MPIESLQIDIQDNPLDGLLTWLPVSGRKEDSPPLEWSGDGSEVLIGTHPTKFAILEAMVEMISGAQSSIFLCNWMFGHPTIERSLVEAADRLDGRVHVLTTLETSVHSRHTDDDEALNDLSRLQDLAGNGVYIRLHPEAHAKFLIADDEVLVTSANIRETSLEQNIETGMRLKDADTVKSFHAFFSHLWLHEAKQHIRPSKKDPRLGNPWSHPPQPPPEATAKAVWTLGNRRMSLAKAIIEIIKLAKSTLRVSTYGLSNAEAGIGKQVIDELITATERGVEITILYHATEIATGRPPREYESNGFHRLMSCKGVTMMGHPNLHAKHIIADSSTGLLFTANLDGSHGLNSGIEVGVHLTSESSNHLAEWHDALLYSFPFELVNAPTTSELYRRKGTKLVKIMTQMVSSSREFEEIKQRLSDITNSPIVICSREDRWINPDNQGEQKRPKPYSNNPRVVVPSVKGGVLVGGIHMVQQGKTVQVELSNTPDFGLHHAHIAPGKYLIQLVRPFTDDEILEMIENHLPAPEKGIVLKEIIQQMREAITQPNEEIPFKLTANGLAEYINNNANKGLLRSHELKGHKLLPVLTEIEASEILKDMLDSSTLEEMQKVLDESNKPHKFTMSKKFAKKLKSHLMEEDSD